jgi:hypothetical protein
MTRTLISGLPFTEVSRFAGGGGICMHACLYKCLLLWKMQYIIIIFCLLALQPIVGLYFAAL